MEPAFAIAFGVLIAVAAYLLLSRNVLRILLGLLVLGARPLAQQHGEGSLGSEGGHGGLRKVVTT